jgi:ribonuclease Y
MSFITNLTGILKGKPAPRSGQTQKRQKPFQFKQVPRASQKQLTLARKQIEQAQTRAREIVLEAKDEAYKIKTEASEQAIKVERQATEIREKISKRETEVEAKTAALNERTKLLTEKDRNLEKRLVEIDKVKKEQLEKLERVASLTREEAKKLILAAVEQKLTPEIAFKEEAEKKARDILVQAMYHGATDYVPEYTVSTVKLPDEDMKGRVIGREGRNIRTFEKTTGVDFDLDEEGVIRLSSFDSVRREIARVALEKLLADGRIQPSRIEEEVLKTKSEIEKLMYTAGEDLCHRLKVYNLPRKVVAMLGRFKYRFSYGQNMISHTLEESKMGIALANEIGANVNTVRLGCLLHDIGKVITEEEGSHVQIGVDFLRRHSIPQPVLDCVAQHHEDEPFSSNEAVLVYIADAISGSRPGARYEDYGEYVTRLEKLENLAKNFKGVANAYAIQAGREVRVIVNPEKLTDAQSIKLAADLRDKIKKEMTYPGQVKVTVIREVRTEKVAK